MTNNKTDTLTPSLHPVAAREWDEQRMEQNYKSQGWRRQAIIVLI